MKGERCPRSPMPFPVRRSTRLLALTEKRRIPNQPSLQTLGLVGVRFRLPGLPFIRLAEIAVLSHATGRAWTAWWRVSPRQPMWRAPARGSHRAAVRSAGPVQEERAAASADLALYFVRGSSRGLT